MDQCGLKSLLTSVGNKAVPLSLGQLDHGRYHCSNSSLMHYLQASVARLRKLIYIFWLNMTPEEISKVRLRQRTTVGDFRLNQGTHHAIKLRWPRPESRQNYKKWQPFFDWSEVKRNKVRDVSIIRSPGLLFLLSDSCSMVHDFVISSRQP